MCPFAETNANSCVRFTWDGRTVGATIDPVTGAFNWLPTEDQGPICNWLPIIASDVLRLERRDLCLPPNPSE